VNIDDFTLDSQIIDLKLFKIFKNINDDESGELTGIV